MSECECDVFLILGDESQLGIFFEREKGFVDFLNSKGCKVRKISFEEFEKFDFEKGIKYGIFADSDYIALNTYSVLAKKNIKLRENVCLVGFDDIFFSRISLPSLTTVHQPTREEGHIAVRKMINMIFGKLENSEVIKPFLRIRESTCGTRPDPEYPEREECLK